MLKHRILFVLALVASVAAVFMPAFADDFADARELYREGRRDEALVRLEVQLQQNPRDARARFLKGVILTDQQRTAEAIEVFRSLTQDFPEMPEPYNNLAVLHAAQGDYQAAREALEMAIRAHPAYAKAHENLGDILAALARQSYRTALELDAGAASARAKLERLGDEIVTRTDATPAKQASEDTADATAAPAPVREDASAAVLAAVHAWADAWSRGDAVAFLAHYAPGFQPPDGRARTQWEASRRARLAQARDVKVSVMEPRVTLDSDTRARVTFRQHYASPTSTRSSERTLHLIQAGGRWLIERESAGAN